MNPVVHFEMPYDDRVRMARFYETAFGWQTQPLGVDKGDYVSATTSDLDPSGAASPGAINGAFHARKASGPAQHLSIVIAVEEIHHAMKQVASAGGTVQGKPREIPGVGLYVSFTDTEHNRVGMLQPVPRAH